MPVDDGAFLAAIDGMQTRIGSALVGVAGRLGASIVAKGMAAAPVERGTLRRSIHMEGPVQSGTSVYVKAFPSTVYGRRIELGFMNMTDSLGRLYHQPPHPYFSPGVGEVMQAAPARIDEAVLEAIGG